MFPPFSKITFLGGTQRAQRHVSNSITTLRFQLGVAHAFWETVRIATQ